MTNYEGQENLDPLILALNEAHGLATTGDLAADLQTHIALGNFAVVQVDELELRDPKAQGLLQPA